MYLRKIALHGFKSFASKTELSFCFQEENKEKYFGVTAIVGPNGSGKSNIADAIRWVMGEQSAKNLRGKKTHDVIFSGSKSRTQMGTSSVSLFFDNSDKKIDIDYRDVTVTRKVHRSGEGEYFINDSRVRLIDVIDLFALIGIGKESQCVLNQGMSDAILNASLSERRSILEEAAGVKPYQIKRERSQKKLIATRENLLQTARLLEEIEPRLRLLKRQAKKAEQRRDTEQELRLTQEPYYCRLWSDLLSEYAQYEEVMSITGREMKLLERKLDSFIEIQKESSKKMQDTSKQDTIRREIALFHREISDLERRRAQYQGFTDAERERYKNRKTFDIIPVDLPFIRKRLSSIQKTLQGIFTFLQTIKDFSEWEVKKKEAYDLLEDLKRLDKECEQSTTRVPRDTSLLEKEEEAFQQRMRENEQRVARLSKDIEDKEKSLREKEKEIEECIGETKNSNESYFAMEKEISSLRQSLFSLQHTYNDKKIEATRCEVKMEDLSKEIHNRLGREPESLLHSDQKELSEKLDIFETERHIERLQSKLAMIGGIDPLIAQEYKETQDRYDFLLRESEDLESAMISLEKIIVEMNERIEKDFKKAFIRINQEFGKYFTLMFDGGTASLEKIRLESKGVSQETEEKNEGEEKEDDAFQWGVDIKIQPPKKRVNRLSMLSGGERSLVSLALLFAIISHNPPPFVVLDEVEAALDEMNSRRFSGLLQSLSSQTQFIVITHNRETMRQANVLYGVTMDDGVSKLLSVRLDQIKKDGAIQS